jgi:NAD(P)H-nitrite reductase large subunit
LKSQTIVIIGNGIAGVSTALELKRLEPSTKVSIISGESDYHYSRPALMYIFMGHMRQQDTMPYPESFWNKQDINLKRAWVTQVDTESQTVHCDDGSSMQYDKVVLATGSKPNKFGWPGQDLQGVQGFYSLQDLDLLEGHVRDAKHAVLVGGGLIGIELAEMLHLRGVHVTFLVRESSYWNRILPKQESELVNRVIQTEGIDLKLNTELDKILDNGNGRCRAVLTKDGTELRADIVGLTAGVSPNTTLAKNSNIEVGRGIVVNEFFESSTDNVFSVGDCAEIRREDGDILLDQLWYTGKMQGKQLAQNLVGERQAYTKPIYYNSAKFLDVEYQIYGDVPLPGGPEKHLYWESKDGRRCVRMVGRNGKFIGLNSLGVRYRQRECETWLECDLSLEDAVEQLPKANFDPEFYKKIEKEIVPIFKEQLK